MVDRKKPIERKKAWKRHSEGIPVKPDSTHQMLWAIGFNMGWDACKKNHLTVNKKE